MKTVALIPAFNEKATIAEVILGCEDYVEEVVVFDDGSTDSTARIAEGLGVTLLRHEDRKGKGSAMKSLFQKAIDMDAEIAVTIDADGQHNPNDIPRLIEALKDSDMVIGGRKGIPSTRAVGNLLLKGFEKMDTQSGFRAYRVSTLTGLMPSEDGMAVESETFAKAKEMGLRIAEVRVQADYSVPNPSKKNMASHFLEVLLNSMKLATFRSPAIYAVAGTLLLLVGGYFALQEWPYLATQGFGTVLLLILAFFCIQTAITIANHNTMERKARK